MGLSQPALQDKPFGHGPPTGLTTAKSKIATTSVVKGIGPVFMGGRIKTRFPHVVCPVFTVVGLARELCGDSKNEKFSKQTQERQETQETHTAIFCIPLFPFALRKGKNRNEKIKKDYRNTRKARNTRNTNSGSTEHELWSCVPNFAGRKLRNPTKAVRTLLSPIPSPFGRSLAPQWT